MSEGESSKKANAKPKNMKDAVEGFQQLRKEQRILVMKQVKIESDIHEHGSVIKNLSQLDPNRKCCHLINGVLVEQTVQTILPTLIAKKDKMTEAVANLQKMIEAKGKEMSIYVEQNNIKLRVDDIVSKNESTTDTEKKGVVVS